VVHLRGGPGRRTNLGLVNLADAHIEVVLGLYASDGSPLGTVTTTLHPHGQRQITDVFALVGAAPEHGFATVTSPSRHARLLAYASVVDTSSGDAVFIGAQ
jgi:hypothetical protein